MNLIKWSNELSVNVKEIDGQHQFFIGLMDRLYAEISSGKEVETLEAIIDELDRYAKLHFTTEERYFDLFNYENTKEHKEAHLELLGQIKEFKENKKEDKTELSWKLLDFMENWLVLHLENQDKKYTKCFNEHGLY